MARSAAELIEWVCQFCRDRGVTVVYEPGAQGRSNGYTAAYEGGIVHHTASNSSPSNPYPTRNILLNGRPDLAGPLSNFGTDYNGVLHVVAFGPANHAGASGGRSMGPLPTSGLFNPKVMGNEVDYSGLTPMSPQQRRTALIWTLAVGTLFGDIQRVRGHCETSVTGKWDPGSGAGSGRSIDMDQWRRDALTVGSPAPPDLSTGSDDAMLILGNDDKWPPGGPGPFGCWKLAYNSGGVFVVMDAAGNKVLVEDAVNTRRVPTIWVNNEAWSDMQAQAAQIRGEPAQV